MTVVRFISDSHLMATSEDEQNSDRGTDSLATLMGASDLFHRPDVAIHDRVMRRHG